MKQIHLRCACCKANTTVPVRYDDTRISYFLDKIPHKRGCYGNSIKMEEVNVNQSPDY